MDFMAMLREERRKAGLEKQKKTQQTDENSALQTKQGRHTSLNSVENEETTIQKESLSKKNEEHPTNRASEYPPFPYTTLSGVSMCLQEPSNLERYKIDANGLRDVWYIADFVSEDEEAEMMKQIYSVASPWKDIRCRRLQCHRSPEMPEWLQSLSSSLVEAKIFPKAIQPNHALLNEYEPGQGIMGHTDGPRYHDLVACLSLGSSSTFSFTERLSTDEIGVKEPRELCTLVLRPRSLVIFTKNAYSQALHSVPAAEQEIISAETANLVPAMAQAGDVIQRGTRISITMRTEIDEA